MNKQALFALLMIVAVLPTLHFLTGNVQSAESAVLEVSPSFCSVSYPLSFTVNVFVRDVKDLYFWHIKLLFSPSVMACTEVVETADGIFHARDTIGLGVTIDNTLGYVGAYDALWTTSGGFNGSGNVCQISFRALQPGISSIAFTDISVYGGTILYLAQYPNTIPFEARDAFVQVNAGGFQSYTFQAVKRGVTYNVVTFTNSTMSNVRYYETSDTIGYLQAGPYTSNGLCAILIPNGLMNVSYFGVLVDGNATYFRVYADGTSHFLTFAYIYTASEITILPTVGGDLDADRRVDMKDVAISAYSFGSFPGTQRWNPIVDVNGDLKADMRDLAFVAKCFGQSYQPV